MSMPGIRVRVQAHVQVHVRVQIGVHVHVHVHVCVKSMSMSVLMAVSMCASMYESRAFQQKCHCINGARKSCITKPNIQENCRIKFQKTSPQSPIFRVITAAVLVLVLNPFL
jgi:hypothetical protein